MYSCLLLFQDYIVLDPPYRKAFNYDAKKIYRFPQKINKLIEYCKLNSIKHLTIRPTSYPKNSNGKASKWIKKHTLNYDLNKDIKEYIQTNETEVLKLAHGAVVYDINGQNLCLANCLTHNTSTESMRQIIYYSNGTISYDWTTKGSILL